MSTKVPKSIASLLKTTSLLRPLVSRVEMLRHATATMHSCLPASLHAHCQVANIEGHTLTIVTDSSAWAAKLRYLMPALLEKLNRVPSLPSLVTAHIRVLPANAADTSYKPPPPHMSENAGNLLAGMAESTTYPELQAAFRRLSRHGQKT